MNGFSASATFTNRFSFMHPEKIKALAIGGFNGELMLPQNEMNGIKLNYPIGTNDFTNYPAKVLILIHTNPFRSSSIWGTWMKTMPFSLMMLTTKRNEKLSMITSGDLYRKDTWHVRKFTRRIILPRSSKHMKVLDTGLHPP